MNTPQRLETVNRRDRWIVLGLTLFALALRLFRLDHESIWLDEAYSLSMTKHGYATLLTRQGTDPGNPFGYFMLLKCWLDLWGAHSIETARAFSALTGALTVAAVWILTRALGLTSRATLLACLLVAVAPPLVYLGQEARTFALFATITTLTAAFVVLIQRNDRAWWWIGFVTCGIVLVYLHYYGFFVLVVLGVDLLAWSWKRGCRPVGKLVAASVGVALGFAPYLPIFLWQLKQGASRGEASWFQHIAFLPAFSLVGRTLIWKEAGTAAVAGLTLAVIGGIFLPLLWWTMRSNQRPRTVPILAVGLPLLLTLLALAGKPMIHSHYLSAVIPAWLLLLACGIDAAWQRHARLIWLPVALLVVLMPASLFRLYGVPHKNDWRTFGLMVGKHGPELPVYYYEDIGEMPFTYYRPDQPGRRILKPFDDSGQSWEREGIFDQMKSDRDGFWLILYFGSYPEAGEEERILARLRKDWIQALDGGGTPQMRLLLWRPK